MEQLLYLKVAELHLMLAAPVVVWRNLHYKTHEARPCPGTLSWNELSLKSYTVGNVIASNKWEQIVLTHILDLQAANLRERKNLALCFQMHHFHNMLQGSLSPVLLVV